MDELVSVIVPFFNSIDTLDRCIRSILNQTYLPIEILLVDDGSDDGSENLCLEYAKTNTCIKVIRQSNGGVSSARNAGLRNAKGRFITFVDADDLLHPDFLAVMVNALKISKAGVAVCEYKKTKNTTSIWDDLSDNTKIEIRSTEDVIKSIYYCNEDIQFCWGKLWERSVIGNTAFQKIKFCEDSLFTITVLSRYCGNIVFIKGKPLYGYIDQPQSATKNLSASHLIDSITVINEVQKIARGKKPEIRIASASFAINNAFFALFHADNSESGKVVRYAASDIIRSNRRTVLKDINAPIKTKIAVILSVASMRLTKTIYKLYRSRFI